MDQQSHAREFDKARKDQTGGKAINPNDPQEKLDLVADHAVPAPATSSRAHSESEGSAGRGAVRRSNERARGSEDADLKQVAARPDNLNRKLGNESAPQRPAGRSLGAGETHRRPGGTGAGFDNSIERSPLHHHIKSSGKGSGAPSPAWEGKRSYDSGHATPGRSRLSTRGSESPDKGATLPKFGEWDDSNPASAEGFTHIFNKAREERHAGTARVPSRPTESSHGNGRPSTSDSSKGCCFPWCR